MQKSVSTIAFAVVLIVFWVTACSLQNNPPPTPTATLPYFPEPPTQIATAIITPGEALALMYGKGRTGSTDQEDTSSVMLTTNTGYDYQVTINTLACFWEFSLQKCLVITEWSEGSCHICGVHIEGAVFEYRPDGWLMREYNSNIALLGSFGHVSKGELLQIGYQKHGILLKSEYANLGYSSTTATIIGETSNSLNVVFQYDPTESQDDVWKYTSELNFYRNQNDNYYYKMIITYFGTDKTGKTPPTQTYTFSGTEYVLLDEQK